MGQLIAFLPCQSTYLTRMENNSNNTMTVTGRHRPCTSASYYSCHWLGRKTPFSLEKFVLLFLLAFCFVPFPQPFFVVWAFYGFACFSLIKRFTVLHLTLFTFVNVLFTTDLTLFSLSSASVTLCVCADFPILTFTYLYTLFVFC